MAITHVYALMLENRSFSHMLAFAGIAGVNPPPASFGFTVGAKDPLDDDLPHEFEDVEAQIAGGTMTGFLANAGPEAMKGLAPAKVPILLQLIQRGILFDNYFSSMPGPTWPNRLLAHAASSGGLDNGIGPLKMNDIISNPSKALQFDNGHIFERLTAKGKTWRIYTGDKRPQVLSLRGMVSKKGDRRFFRPLDDLAKDLAAGDTVNYVFIEPYYDLFDEFEDGNSQHPVGTIAEGEKLMAYVYNAIFTSPSGKDSALFISWDEHGGFFDHIRPPAATPPGDTPHNAPLAKHPKGFKFDRFGVRVPAVLISPWLKQGLGSRIYGSGKHFDHSSIVRALRSTFGLGAELTKRDKASPDWNAGATLSSRRALGPALPAARARIVKRAGPPARIAAKNPIGGNVLAWTRIAMDIDWSLAEVTGKPPLFLTTYNAKLKAIDAAVEAGRSGRRSSKAALVAAEQAALEYMAAVERLEIRVEASRARPTAAAKRKPVRKVARR